MSSSNYRRNKAAIDEFRKALKAEIDDLSEIDVKVLNKAVNEGIRWLKDRTPTGRHPNPVTFTIKNGPDAGKLLKKMLYASEYDTLVEAVQNLSGADKDFEALKNDVKNE